jgi:hypothetical protein
MKEYTTLLILEDWWSKIKKEKGWRDKLHVVRTISESLDHLWAHAHACDPVASMWVAHEMSNMFYQTSQNMVRLPPCSCTDKAWNSYTLIGDIMCTCSPNTCTFHWKIDSSLNGTSTWYHIVDAFKLLACEKYILEKFVISLHANASTIQPSSLALLPTVYLSFFNSLSWLYIHLNYTGSPSLASQGKCNSKCCITLNHIGGYTVSILYTSSAISFSNLYIIAFETKHKSICRNNWVQQTSLTHQV